MRVRWLRRALQNLDAEAAYIAQDSPQSAAGFVRHLLESADLLAAQPQMSRPGRVPGTREPIAFINEERVAVEPQ